MIDPEALKNRILENINRKNKEQEKIKNIVSSASYTKKDVKKYFNNEYVKKEIKDTAEVYSKMMRYGQKPKELEQIENLIKLENGEADDDDFKKEDLPPFKRTVDLEKRNFLKKLGLGAIGFLGALAVSKADVLINANGVFKDGKEYSMGGMPYRIVAASDASDESKAKADYVCDGSGDQAEIQNAVNDLPSQGGVVFLTEGNYNIAYPNKVSIGKHIKIIGSGMKSTILKQNYDYPAFVVSSNNILLYLKNLGSYNSSNGINKSWIEVNNSSDGAVIILDGIYTSGFSKAGLYENFGGLKNIKFVLNNSLLGGYWFHSAPLYTNTTINFIGVFDTILYDFRNTNLMSSMMATYMFFSNIISTTTFSGEFSIKGNAGYGTLNLYAYNVFSNILGLGNSNGYIDNVYVYNSNCKHIGGINCHVHNSQASKVYLKGESHLYNSNISTINIYSGSTIYLYNTQFDNINNYGGELVEIGSIL